MSQIRKRIREVEKKIKQETEKWFIIFVENDGTIYDWYNSKKYSSFEEFVITEDVGDNDYIIEVETVSDKNNPPGYNLANLN